MTIVIESAIIIAYMINDRIGMALMLTFIVGKILFAKRNAINKVFELMIVALPMSYVGFAGVSMHQIFSWYNFFLVIFMVMITTHSSAKIMISISGALSLFIIFFCMLLNIFWTRDITRSFIEIAQIMIMLIPLLAVHSNRMRSPFSRNDIYELLYKYADVCVATAIAMLVQYYLYNYTHRQIGTIVFSGNSRAQLCVLFKGASILPIFIGIGIAFLFIELLDKKLTIIGLIKIIVMFFAVILNSSRTALFSLIIVSAMISIQYLLKAPSLRGMLLTGIGFTSFYFAVDYITRIRSKLQGFLDANGRVETWKNGIHVWTESFKNFILGDGFSLERWTAVAKPHNMIIQTLTQCGLVITLVVIGMLTKYLLDNRHSKYFFIPVFVVLSGMLVTDFYANAFITVIFMLVDLYGRVNDSRQGIYSSAINRRLGLGQKEARSI